MLQKLPGRVVDVWRVDIHELCGKIPHGFLEAAVGGASEVVENMFTDGILGAHAHSLTNCALIPRGSIVLPIVLHQPRPDGRRTALLPKLADAILRPHATKFTIG